MSGIARIDANADVKLGLGSIAVLGQDMNYIWELGMKGDLYGFYKTVSGGRLWWPIYFENLEDADNALRYIARIYNWRVVKRS